MNEGITCYERDEDLCEDPMCLRLSCRLRNDRLSKAVQARREAIAETIWRAEFARATGRERLVSWKDGVSDEDKAKYLFIADAVLAGMPPEATEQQIAAEFSGALSEGHARRLASALREKFFIGLK